MSIEVCLLQPSVPVTDIYVNDVVGLFSQSSSTFLRRI